MIEIKEIITDNKDLQYIKECAESVGMDVTDRTAYTIPFIAEVMRKMKEQSIVIPEGATNGEVAMQVFRDKGESIKMCTYNDKLIGVKLIKEWWNSPYRKEQKWQSVK